MTQQLIKVYLIGLTISESVSMTVMVQSLVADRHGGRHGPGAVTERLHKHKIKRKLIGLVLVV